MWLCIPTRAAQNDYKQFFPDKPSLYKFGSNSYIFFSDRDFSSIMRPNYPPRQRDLCIFCHQASLVFASSCSTLHCKHSWSILSYSVISKFPPLCQLFGCQGRQLDDNSHGLLHSQTYDVSIHLFQYNLKDLYINSES